jgi:hypothetical protein
MFSLVGGYTMYYLWLLKVECACAREAHVTLKILWCSCVIISLPRILPSAGLVSDAFLSYGGRSYGSNSRRSCRKQNQTPARPPPTSEAKKKELKITQLN